MMRTTRRRRRGFVDRRKHFVGPTEDVVEYRPGFAVIYPMEVAWPRMRALFARSRGADTLATFPIAMRYTRSYARLKFLDAQAAALATILLVDSGDIAPLAESLFKDVEASQTVAGLEAVYLAVLNVLGHTGDPLYNRGVYLWEQLSSTCEASEVLLLDKELAGVAMIDAVSLRSWQLGVGSDADALFMGGLRPQSRSFAATDVRIILNERVGALDAEEMCKGLVQAAVSAGLLALASRVPGGASSGASGGVLSEIFGRSAASGAGSAAAELFCGFLFRQDTTNSDINNPPDAGSDPPSAGMPNTPGQNDHSSSCDPKDAGTGGTVDCSEPPDDNDSMPDPEGDGSGDPRSLGMRLLAVSSLAVVKQLRHTTDVNRIRTLRDVLPSIDFRTGVVRSWGLASSAPLVREASTTMVDPEDRVTRPSVVVDQALISTSEVRLKDGAATLGFTAAGAESERRLRE